MKDISRLILAFVLVFGAVVLALFFISPQNGAWYASLAKPVFTPPDRIFGILWLLSYILMAIALVRVLSCKEDPHRRMWLFAFCTQILLNVLWAVLFFSLHGLLLSSIDALVLWFAVVVVTLDSWEIDGFSFWLLVPYLAWVTFAVILNVALWWIN